MSELLKGAPVAREIKEAIKEKLHEKNQNIGLGLIRMGSKPDDISYEKSIVKQAEEIGINIITIELPEDIGKSELTSLMAGLNNDSSLHGILVFRPMSNPEIEKIIVETLDPNKDVDGITSASMAMQYSGFGQGFHPCTAEACMKILSYYDVKLEGKKVVVIGRSQVIGKPVAMMMLGENATVTICHSKTEHLKQTVKQADIVIAAIGKDRYINDQYLSEGQIVIDVGINFDYEGTLHGDVDFISADGVVKAISPVPGGVGNVTTALLFVHTLEASMRRDEIG